LQKKSVLITGGTKGIGKAIALEFADKGYNVGINYSKDYDSAVSTLKELTQKGVDAEIFKADVSSSLQCEELVKNFIERFNKIDVLVNNAGISLTTPLASTSCDDWNNIISTNLSSAFYLSKEVLSYFLKYKNGNIINISSVWGQIGASCEVAYSASKAGIIGLTKALAKELGPSGIRVNCICPGLIDTDMNSNLSNTDKELFAEETPLMKIGTPCDIAPLAAFLASEHSKFITGAIVPVNGGYSC